MPSSDMAIRSPAVSNMSISRGSGTSAICSAIAVRSSVVSPIAETTTMTSSPPSRACTTRSATAWIRSTVPTDVPPNFITTMGTVRPLPGLGGSESTDRSRAGPLTPRTCEPGTRVPPVALGRPGRGALPSPQGSDDPPDHHDHPPHAQFPPLHDRPLQEFPDHDRPLQESPDQELPDQEFPDHDTPLHESPDHDRPLQEMPLQELPDQEFPDHDFPFQMPPDHDLPCASRTAIAAGANGEPTMSCSHARGTTSAETGS